MKNLWSLQVGEAVVAEELSKRFPPKDKYQVFIPLNNQLEDIDLILADLDKKSYVTIQVKESNTRVKESKLYPNGKIRWGWFQIKKKNLEKPRIKVDYYVFLRYSLTEKREFHNDFIIVTPDDLIKKIKENKKKLTGGKIFTFNFEVEDGKANDIKIAKNKQETPYTDYLNDAGFKKIQEHFENQ